MGNTSAANIGAPAPQRNTDLDDLLAAAGDMRWTEGEGDAAVTVTLRDVLADIEADDATMAVIDACTLGGRAQ